METNEPRAIGLGDLGQITLRGNIAFAVRCAMRARPCMELLGDVPGRREQLDAIDAAIRVAEAFCKGTLAEPGSVAAVVQNAAAVASTTGRVTRNAGYAAVRAAEAVVHAVEALQTANESRKLEAVACSFGAGRVLVANVDTFAVDLVVAALFTDMKALQAMTSGSFADFGAPIDPSASGPLAMLWPAGVPQCFAMRSSQP